MIDFALISYGIYSKLLLRRVDGFLMLVTKVERVLASCSVNQIYQLNRFESTAQ